MEEPQLQDYGLTQNYLDINNEQIKRYNEAVRQQEKNNIIISFFINCAIIFAISFIILLIVAIEEIGYFWVLIFSSLLISLPLTNCPPYNFLDKSDEIKERYIDEDLNKRCEKYHKDFSQYKSYVKKLSKDYWLNCSGHEFERRVADLYRKLGYTATVTKGSGDGGIDIILRQGSEKIAVQCKHHSRPVGPNDVRALQGVVASNNYTKGIFVSLKGFTPTVAEEVGRSRITIELIQLFDLLKLAKSCGDNIDKPSETEAKVSVEIKTVETKIKEKELKKSPKIDSEEKIQILVDELVYHEKFGQGRVCENDGVYIVVDFNGQQKKFKTPDCFINGFLKKKK